MDPSNVKAAEGSQRVEMNPESESFCEVDDIADSENEVRFFLVIIRHTDKSNKS